MKSSGICCANCAIACCSSISDFARSAICFMIASRFLSPLWSLSRESISRSWLRAKSCAVEASSWAFMRLPMSSDNSDMRSSSADISSRALSFSSVVGGLLLLAQEFVFGEFEIALERLEIGLGGEIGHAVFFRAAHDLFGALERVGKVLLEALLHFFRCAVGFSPGLGVSR